jgi:hypothetical protein
MALRALPPFRYTARRTAAEPKEIVMPAHHRSCILACSLASLIAALGQSACSRTSSSAPEFTPGSVVAPASAAQRAALIDRMKTLAGTWEMTDEKGQTSTAAVYTVTSNGSVVRQIMFPGSSHEMTNMFHMDGPSMVMVHYCALGNQPHMRAVSSDPHADRIVLHSDGVTNRTSADQQYMAELTIIFKDANTIREEWRSFDHGKLGEHADFELHRKH